MKSIYKFLILSVLCAGMMTACSLSEYNPSSVPTDLAYKYKSGYDGLINACYVNNYSLYGKMDYIALVDGGADAFISYKNNETGPLNYDQKLNTTYGPLWTIWSALYGTVNYCNAAIYYANKGLVDCSSDSLKSEVAEAYFLRAHAYFNIVEQWGGVYLTTESSLQTGIVKSPKRSSEAEFYDLIISDLKNACTNLPYTQTLRGRITKKAAYGFLARVYLQRTRLKEANASEYARLALVTAQELINNPSEYNCALYTSDATTSGYSKLWDGANNKNNSEFLCFTAVDPTGWGINNPGGANQGRTRQYFLPDFRSFTDLGGTEKALLYGRCNSTWYAPSKYLLTQIFEPIDTTPDTRFGETFTYRFYASANATYTQAMCSKYGKDTSLVGMQIKDTRGAYTVASGSLNLEETNTTNMASGLYLFVPNWTVANKQMMPAFVSDPTTIYDSNGFLTTTTYYSDVFPALRKYSSRQWASNNAQYWLGDYPIIRLGDVYLIAAEAALRYNNDQTTAQIYVQAIRNRAAVTGRQYEMAVPASQVTLDFILAERARELTGECDRWYDLKRYGYITRDYLQSKNPGLDAGFSPTKHIVRPIPQNFLDAISNPQEFGNNGY